jgi:MFS family permease
MYEFKEHLPKIKLGQTFQALCNPKYRIYASGQFVSNAGTWMQNIALSWVVYKMTGSPLALGLVQFASNLPLLLFMYFGGLIADRFDKRRILIVTQWLDMTQAVVLTLLVLTGHITVPWLIGLAIFLGCVTAIEAPCRQAFVGELVDKKNLTSAIGINSAIVNLSRLIGPAMAGLLMSTGGEALCFIVNALSYLAAIWALNKMGSMSVLASSSDAETTEPDTTATQPEREPDATTTQLVREPDTTVSAWLLQPHIRNVILLVAATSVFGFQYSVLLPVIAAQNLHDTTGALLALLSASLGIGALTGSLVIATKGSVAWLNRRIGFAALILAASIALLAFSSTLVLSMVAMAGCGIGVGIQLGGSNSLLQLQVPAKLRGRVMSIFSTLLMGLGPFTALLAGFTAEHLGLKIALSITAAIMTAASITYLRRAKYQTPPVTGAENGDKAKKD